MNRCDGAKEKLSARRIRAGNIRMVHRAGLGCVQRGERGIVGYHNVRVIAEPLHAAIPNIAANVVIGARRYCLKMQCATLRPSTRPMTITRFGKFGVQKNSRMARRYATPATASGMRAKCFALAAELARANDQRHQQNGAEPVQPVRRSELHRSPGRESAITCCHCFSHAAVRGARAGASRSSAARRVRSLSMSMS